MMIKFVYHAENTEWGDSPAIQSIDINVTDQATLTELLDSFEAFLKACGYHFDGKLDIIPEEEYYGSNDNDSE
jgi:hypothetical protein